MEKNCQSFSTQTDLHTIVILRLEIQMTTLLKVRGYVSITRGVAMLSLIAVTNIGLVTAAIITKVNVAKRNLNPVIPSRSNVHDVEQNKRCVEQRTQFNVKTYRGFTVS